MMMGAYIESYYWHICIDAQPAFLTIFFDGIVLESFVSFVRSFFDFLFLCVDQRGKQNWAADSTVNASGTSLTSSTKMIHSSNNPSATLTPKQCADDGLDVRDDDHDTAAAADYTIESSYGSYRERHLDGDPNVEDLNFLESLCSPWEGPNGLEGSSSVCGNVSKSVMKYDNDGNGGAITDRSAPLNLDGTTANILLRQMSSHLNHSVRSGISEVIAAPSSARLFDTRKEEENGNHRSSIWASAFQRSGNTDEIDRYHVGDVRDLWYAGSGGDSAAYDDQTVESFDSMDDETYYDEGYANDYNSVSDSDHEDDYSSDQDSEVMSEVDFRRRKY
jgi:hypothetical protein